VRLWKNKNNSIFKNALAYFEIGRVNEPLGLFSTQTLNRLAIKFQS
jgi:hypothetical protein